MVTCTNTTTTRPWHAHTHIHTRMQGCPRAGGGGGGGEREREREVQAPPPQFKRKKKLRGGKTNIYLPWRSITCTNRSRPLAGGSLNWATTATDATRTRSNAEFIWNTLFYFFLWAANLGVNLPLNILYNVLFFFFFYARAFFFNHGKWVIQKKTKRLPHYYINIFIKT